MEATEPEMARKARGPWTFNRLLLTMAFFDLVLALLVSGGFSPAAFLVYGAFLIPGLVFIALLTWRPNPWIYLATGIAVSYLFILFLPFIIGGLANPASPYEFSGDVLGLVAVFWALPAGVLGFLQGRRGTAQLDARSGWRTRQGLYALGVASVAVGAILASAIAYNHAAGTQTGGGFDFQPSVTVNVTAQNFAFNPATFAVSVQTITAIAVTNRDGVLHTFTYELNGQTYSHDLLPGTTTKFLVFFDVPGSVPFWCIPHRSMGMTGTITVSPQSGSQMIGVNRQDTTSNWVLQISNVPAPHALTTTTFLMRWSSNSTIVNPPGQASLETLKTASGGIQFIPVSGQSQTGLRVNDVIVVSKSLSYTSGMPITITDGSSILWQGNL